jgi:TRAP-type C4-dicarboxylate transport system permease small subunit
MVKFVERWTDTFSKWLMVFAAMWAFFLAFYILADVIGRAFDMPFKGTHEVVKNSIVMIAFMQAAYCVRSRSMLRADFLLHLMSPNVQRVINVIGYLLAAAFFAVLFDGTWPKAIHAIASGEFEGEGALRVPTWPARVVVLFTAALLTVNYLFLAYDEVFDPAPEGVDAAAAGAD